MQSHVESRHSIAEQRALKSTVFLFFLSYHNSLHPGNRMKRGRESEQEKRKEKKGVFFSLAFVSLESSRREILVTGSKHSSSK